MHPAGLSAYKVEIDTPAGCVPGGLVSAPKSLGQALRLEILREIPEQAELRERWNALVFRLDRPQVFYTYEWALAVQRAYSQTLPPLLILAYDRSNCLCGVAALATDTTGRRASFLCATTGDYCDFLCEPKHSDAFVGAVFGELRRQGIETIVFTNLPADSATVSAVEKNSRRHSFRRFTRTAYLCAQVSLAQLDRRSESNPALPRKKMLRRFLNAMGREHPVRLDHSHSWDAVETILPDFMRSHVARFLIQGRISNVVSGERRIFLVELSRLLSESGWLALTRMISGDRVVAWNYGFQFHNTWFWYQPTFDMTLEKYSPGFCLLAKIIEEAAADPAFGSIDLGLGAEDYKSRFANQVRPTLWIQLTSSVCQHAWAVARYRIGEALKKQPQIETTIRSVRERYRAFRRRLQVSGLRHTCVLVAKRALEAIASSDEILFYEVSEGYVRQPTPPEFSLATIDLNLLATAAMQHPPDEETLSYVIRCARRLRMDNDSTGFALANENCDFLQFIWVRPFEGFQPWEEGGTVASPAPDSLVIFDPFIPVRHRDGGYHAHTLALVIARIRREGKPVWISNASTNEAFLRGLEGAGFTRSFSVLRYRLLWWQRILQPNAAPANPPRS